MICSHFSTQIRTLRGQPHPTFLLTKFEMGNETSDDGRDGGSFHHMKGNWAKQEQTESPDL